MKIGVIMQVLLVSPTALSTNTSISMKRNGKYSAMDAEVLTDLWKTSIVNSLQKVLPGGTDVTMILVGKRP